MAVFRVFIGFDPKETLAYHVASQSILEKTTLDVSVSPIGNTTLPKSEWWRERGPYDTTEFSNARFMVPFKSKYQGWSLFMDPDVLMLRDIAELYALRDERYAVMCVHHQYQPKEGKKAMGEQTKYKRKNWSSVVLFNNERCRDLTVHYVNSANGLDLHQFAWLHSNEIGELPRGWNHLVGENIGGGSDINLVHFTLGGPYWEGYEHTDFAEEWSQAYSRMKHIERSSHRV